MSLTPGEMKLLHSRDHVTPLALQAGMSAEVIDQIMSPNHVGKLNEWAKEFSRMVKNRRLSKRKW